VPSVGLAIDGLQMSEPILNRSEELAEFAVACPFPVIKCDDKGNILLMNPAFLGLLNQLAIPEEQAKTVLPEGYVAQLKQMLDGQDAAAELVREISGRILKCSFVPIRGQREVLVIVSHLTEPPQAANWVRDDPRELEHLNRRMKEVQTQLIQSEKMASLGQLVAGIAHEINTPIGSINSNNDILIRSVSKLRDFLNCSDCPPSVRENPEVVKIMGILEDINHNNRIACDRIMNIIRSLRNFARLDEAELRRVNIHEGIDSSLILVHHQIKNRIQVVKEYGDIPEIECYPNQLNQVFVNLLVNAEQAMPDKGTITIRTFRERDQIKVAISDTGVGIRKEHLERIFDPGFTTKGVGMGTGLGLSICDKIIADHHGKIAVESKEGKGTTFTITLPIK
jgi:signal transduction histidine kinase